MNRKSTKTIFTLMLMSSMLIAGCGGNNNNAANNTTSNNTGNTPAATNTAADDTALDTSPFTISFFGGDASRTGTKCRMKSVKPLLKKQV